jgi:uncharacterized protein (DUF342 family)
MNKDSDSSNKSLNLDLTSKKNNPAVDAVVTALVSSDQLEAYLYIKPPENGGDGPTLKDMTDVLAKHKISYNVDMEKLRSLAINPVYQENILIARGLAPVDGTDGRAEFKIRTVKSELKPRVNEDGTVDYRDLELVENVSKGQVLCVITPPTEGTPGISVQGRKLIQKRGRSVPSYIGSNTVYNQDCTKIISKIDGQVEFNGIKINVSETFTVSGNIDISTGNISVAGNLCVNGMVYSGYVAEAKGNIIINGNVENATVRAGGSIILKSGVINSTIYGSGNLNCKYLENCSVTVKGNIEAGSIVKSNIICGKSIRVMGSIAKIVGGSYIVGDNIEARSIGSEAGVNTTLEIGSDYTLVERQRELLALISEIQIRISKLKPLISLLQEYEDSNRITAEKKEALDKANNSYLHDINALDEAKQELDEINNSINKKGFGYILCSDSVFPGTKIVMGKETLTVSEIIRNAKIYYEKGTVCIRNIFG